MNLRELCKNRKTVKSFFPNGTMYSSSVYENDKLAKCSKFYSNGQLAQKVEYTKGNIVQKEVYNRSGEISETYSYHYDNMDYLEKIVNEKINTIYTVTFERDSYSKKIRKIYVKQNNLIIRRLEFEYSNNQIICYERTNFQKLSYKLAHPPVADESWLNVAPANSLVMRKLRSALELCA